MHVYFLPLQELEGIAFAGKVNCDKETQICNAANIQAYPTLRFYQGDKPNQGQVSHAGS